MITPLIHQLAAADMTWAQPGLIDLLQDAVESGASVGFMPPLDRDAARAYWDGVVAALQADTRILLVARSDAGIVGSVQLDLAQQPNGRHRAEVMKLLVLRSARRQGIGRALMAAVEDAAREVERSLLVLDTRRGDAAEHLYRRSGYTEGGIIPRFAMGADGLLHDTVLFYRLI